MLVTNSGLLFLLILIPCKYNNIESGMLSSNRCIALIAVSFDFHVCG